MLTGSGTALHISGASHLEISDLEIVRAGTNGLSIDDGDNRDRPAHHVILRNLRVTDTNGRGNNDGIKLSGVDDLVIDRCVVRRWGNGGSGIDLVGCHRVVVSDCLFADGGANAVQFKGGSADVRVAGCKFLDAGERAVQFGGVTGDGFFRPPLERTPAGTRAEVRNGVVEGCVFVGGEAAVAAVARTG
ncbi:MAG: right-handed parallel beta-helix repeat-containing protein [Gemmataceae bacterium]